MVVSKKKLKKSQILISRHRPLWNSVTKTSLLLNVYVRMYIVMRSRDTSYTGGVTEVMVTGVTVTGVMGIG